MKDLKGNVITKKLKDMTEKELLEVDIKSLSKKDQDKFGYWLIKKRNEFLAPMRY